MASARRKGWSLLPLSLALVALGCAERIPVKAVAHPNDVSLRTTIPPWAKFVLRRPNSTGRVSEGSLNPEWGQFEVGLFNSGLQMVDSALLEQLLMSNAAASYQEIHHRTGADVIIEVIELGIKKREVEAPGKDERVFCQTEELTAKLVNVATGSMIGTMTVGRSSCPHLAFVHKVSPCTMVLEDGTKARNAEWEDHTCVAKLPRRPADSEYWQQLGKRLGTLIQQRLAKLPTEEPAGSPGGLGPGGNTRPGYVGLGATAVPAGRAEALGLGAGEGVVVGDIAPGGPADRAGLKRDDVILLIDGVRVTSAGFVQQVAQLGAGRTVKFVIARGDQRQTLEVTTAAPPGQ